MEIKILLRTRPTRTGWTYELVIVTAKGRRRKSLNTTDEKLAKELLALAEAELGSADDAGGLSNLAELYDADLERRGCTLNHRKTVRFALRSLVNIIGDKPLSDISRTDIEIYLDAEKRRGRLPGGISDTLRWIKSAFSYAINQALLNDNPIAGIKPPRQVRRVPRRFSKFQMALLLQEIKRQDDFDFAVLLVLTGMRRNEALKLRWNQIDFDEGKITLTGKGGHEREIPVCNLLAKVLQRRERVNAFVWPGHKQERWGVKLVDTQSVERIGRRFRVYLRAAHLYNEERVKDGCFHRFRYTTASILAEGGFTELDIGFFLGHAGRSVTTGYIALAGGKRPAQMAQCLEAWLIDCCPDCATPKEVKSE